MIRDRKKSNAEVVGGLRAATACLMQGMRSHLLLDEVLYLESWVLPPRCTHLSEPAERSRQLLHGHVGRWVVLVPLGRPAAQPRRALLALDDHAGARRGADQRPRRVRDQRPVPRAVDARRREAGRSERERRARAVAVLASSASNAPPPATVRSKRLRA